MNATEMKEFWQAHAKGSGRIARNYIPESVGLEAVAYCEKMVALFDLDDVQEAHDEAIRLTKIKFKHLFH